MGSEKLRGLCRDSRGLVGGLTSALLVSFHSGQMSGLHGLVYVKFHFRLWAGWALVLSCGVFLAKVDRYHPVCPLFRFLTFLWQCGQRRSCCIWGRSSDLVVQAGHGDNAPNLLSCYRGQSRTFSCNEMFMFFFFIFCLFKN